jgi:DNA sulfur modification protein DndD
MAELADADDGKRASKVLIGAALTSNYEIVVYSSENTTLNPDYELSGAQKRALTFSFIWALTEISQVIAPRIIDTPLGMMSGLVKRRVLELITLPVQQASDIEKQVVLFLTRDEIRGIESVIAARAGRVITFTNSDQFPGDVINDPGIDVPEVMKCECSNRQYCYICARRNDEQYGLVERVTV